MNSIKTLLGSSVNTHVLSGNAVLVIGLRRPPRNPPGCIVI